MSYRKVTYFVFVAPEETEITQTEGKRRVSTPHQQMQAVVRGDKALRAWAEEQGHDIDFGIPAWSRNALMISCSPDVRAAIDEAIAAGALPGFTGTDEHQRYFGTDGLRL